MHPELAAAVDDLRLTRELPALAEAAELSQGLIHDSRAFLQARLDVELPVDLVVLGSVARGEATSESDLDYMVLTFGLLDDPGNDVRSIIEAVEELRETRLEMEEPGRTQLFGKLVAAQDLVEHIGLEEDSNRNHTRRILLLTESESMFRPDQHERLLRATIRRYLADYEQPKPGVPRFLLNDVLRYWRTLAVDYQAKQWGTNEPEWGLRYLKLIISRKLMIAGTVMSLFLCEEATEDYFVRQFQMPALARLVQVRAVLAADGMDALATVLSVADEFVGALADADFRQEAKAVTSRTNILPSSRFAHLQQRARELQTGLQTMFFDSPELAAKARKYLSF